MVQMVEIIHKIKCFFYHNQKYQQILMDMVLFPMNGMMKHVLQNQVFMQRLWVYLAARIQRGLVAGGYVHHGRIVIIC